MADCLHLSRAPYPQDDNEPGMPLDEHNRLELVWKQSAYIARTCGTSVREHFANIIGSTMLITYLICELLQFIGCQLIIVPEYMVM